MPPERTPEEIQELEEKREAQKSILESESIKNIYIAATARDSPEELIQTSTRKNYINGLKDADAETGKLLAKPLINAYNVSVQNGLNPYEHGSLTPIELLNSSIPFYQTALNHVKVSDVLEYLEIAGVHESRISNEQRDMYMFDLEEENQELYSSLKMNYFGYVQTKGIGDSITDYAESNRSSLESLLQSDANAENSDSE